MCPVPACLRARFQYAGMKNSSQCMCGIIGYGHHGLDPNSCKMPCAGTINNALELCGGSSNNSVYMAVKDPPASELTIVPSKRITKPSTAKPSESKTNKRTTKAATAKPSKFVGVDALGHNHHQSHHHHHDNNDNCICHHHLSHHLDGGYRHNPEDSVVSSNNTFMDVVSSYPDADGGNVGKCR